MSDSMWPEVAQWGATTTPGVGAVVAAASGNRTSWNAYEVCQTDGIAFADRCAYSQMVYDCHSSSSIQYLQFAYCDIGDANWFAYILFSLWLVFLFLNLVLVLDSRVVPNINTVAKTLGMSDSLAGVTLLAFGNGAADVFSAAAAINASPTGATLAISGLVGGGLFVVTIVAGVLAFKFQPEISLKKIGRDGGGYFIAIGSVGLMVYLYSAIYIWSGVLLLCMYVAYVAYVVFSERKDAAQLAEVKKGDTNAAQQNNPAFDATLESAIAPAEEDPLLVRSDASPIPMWECPHDGSWQMTFDRLKAVLLDTCEEDWEEKTRFGKALVILQAPLHSMLILTCPSMHHGDPMLTWDRNHHVLTTFFMCPFITLIFKDDAFYAGDFQVAPMLLACIVGVVLAFFVRMSSEVETPPKWQSAFAAVGFVVALTWIYVLSDEIVAVLRTCGIMLTISPALIGMTILGIGNGSCDLVANYLMARAGHETTAIAAIYAGPMFNLLVGLGLAAIVGGAKYEQPLYVSSHLQLYIGMIFVLMTLLVGTVYSITGKFNKSHAVCFFTVYTLFLMITCTLYA